jgi:hypothetical protein
MDFLNAVQRIGSKLTNIPKHWDGKAAILEMKKSNYGHWRQMEWIGFYFQFLCETNLKDSMTIPGPKYGNTTFDGFLKIPWDFKSHAMNTSSHEIIVNDRQAVEMAIRDYGSVGLILALGKATYNDENRTFQKWHEKLKGGPTEYSLDRVNRGAWSRLRKVSLDLQQISFIIINNDTLDKCGTFQSDFRNANGSPRKEKILVDLEKIENELIYFIDF